MVFTAYIQLSLAAVHLEVFRLGPKFLAQLRCRTQQLSRLRRTRCQLRELQVRAVAPCRWGWHFEPGNAGDLDLVHHGETM